MNTVTPETLKHATDCIAENPYIVLYVSRPGCGVCSALKPRVEGIVRTLPRALLCSIDLDRVPEAAGEFSVFTIPAILLFIDGRETIREARYVSLEDLRGRMERLYALRFEN